MPHLLHIDDLSDSEIARLMEESLSQLRPTPINKQFAAMALLFKESSTRTRVSFERAGQVLGLQTILLDSDTSSLSKGETVVDTLRLLYACDVGLVVLRSGDPEDLSEIKNCKDPLPVVINGGNSTDSHPTQALLDLAVLCEEFGGLKNLRGKSLCLVGNISHSRVASSWIRLADRVGLTLFLMSPEEWQSSKELAPNQESIRFDLKVLQRCDVVMALRVQRERLDQDGVDHAEYVNKYQIKTNTLLPSQRLMHPAPVNWGVELHPDWQKDSRSLILRQQSMGLQLRTLLIKRLFGT